jgi:hypothetical protein
MRLLSLIVVSFALAGGIASAQVKSSSATDGCLGEIRDAYRDEFLTYAGATRVWWANLKDRFGVRLSQQDQSVIRGRVTFESALRCYEFATGSKTLSLDLSPSGFKGVFNGIVKDRGISLPPL